MLLRHLPFLFTATLLDLAATSASAQWTVTSLHPAGTGESIAWATSMGQHVGYVTIDGFGHAAVWNGASADWTDLNPPGWRQSYISAADGDEQVGYGFGAGNFSTALLWHGSTASIVNLGPFSSEGSSVHGVRAGRQVGQARFGGKAHAGMWSGTSESWVDLSSSSFETSAALGVSDNQQVGFATFNASGAPNAILWAGNAISWTNLHPQGASESVATAVDAGIQVGYAVIGGAIRASLWTGSATTWVDLSPPGSGNSFALATHAERAVGYANIGGINRAIIWYGSANSWEDLSASLVGEWGDTRAFGVWSDSTDLYVVGSGFNLSTNQHEALLWKRPCHPQTTIQPTSTHSCSGELTLFDANASGPGPLTFQWQIQLYPSSGSTWYDLATSAIVLPDGASALADSPTLGQTGISVTTSFALSQYQLRCIVSSSCGSESTSSAVLNILDSNAPLCTGCPLCIADYDGNGGVDGADLGGFFANYESGQRCADLDLNGGIDGADLAIFFQFFESGEC